MSYELQALIGPAELVAVAAAEVSAARPRPLAQGLALIPATPEFLAALRFGDGEPVIPAAPGVTGFGWFSDGLERRLAAWSKAGPIACVEADYFGGTGTQRAALWADGRLALGPLTSAELEPFPPEGSPISRVLRRLGVRLPAGTDAYDEFDAAGLGAHRTTTSWASTP
ncbi:hypothetical protein [Kitasatospora sp. NPDC008115]|uniref:hypothetical protein n=1 Tax=Kitasatospora sp. NPDC008115 TaxID=3364022 RepID=UPI0036E3B145